MLSTTTILLALFTVATSHGGVQNRLYNRQVKVCKAILDKENLDKPDRFSQDTELTVVVEMTITEGQNERFEKILERILNKSKREEHLLSLNTAIDGNKALMVGVFRNGKSYLTHIAKNQEQSSKLDEVSNVVSVRVSGVKEDLDDVRPVLGSSEEKSYFELNSGSIRS